MLTRREEREQAFILLFEKSFNGETDISELYEIALENEVVSDSEFIKNLAFKTTDNKDEIDSVIERNLVNWKMSRISKVALAVLRLAV
ncbi:MAG: transcription antitermination factor NusB, partial [Clostridia bacterium]|nr:transcription antitermination factor NusB [Clostridia bacterium]